MDFRKIKRRIHYKNNYIQLIEDYVEREFPDLKSSE